MGGEGEGEEAEFSLNCRVPELEFDRLSGSMPSGGISFSPFF